MKNETMVETIDKLISQAIYNQGTDPLHRTDWISIRESLQDAVEKLNDMMKED